MQGSQTLGKTRKNKNNQRHSAGNIDYDNLSGSQDADEPPVVQVQTQCGFRTRSKTLGESSGKSEKCIFWWISKIFAYKFWIAAPPPPPPRRTTTTITTTNIHDHEKIDPGTKSEGEDDSQTGTMPKSKATLGRTPNHLTLRWVFLPEKLNLV